MQQAFIDHDAMQCGFCTPGMVMSCAALLARKPEPDARRRAGGDERQPVPLRDATPKVFEATLAAAGKKGA